MISFSENKRKYSFIILGLSIALLAFLYIFYYIFIGSNHVTTDNAYVGAEIAIVTPATSGIIKTINYKDTDVVKTGDILVIIDDTDSRLVFAKTKADIFSLAKRNRVKAASNAMPKARRICPPNIDFRSSFRADTMNRPTSSLPVCCTDPARIPASSPLP